MGSASALKANSYTPPIIISRQASNASLAPSIASLARSRMISFNASLATPAEPIGKEYLKITALANKGMLKPLPLQPTVAILSVMIVMKPTVSPARNTLSEPSLMGVVFV